MNNTQVTQKGFTLIELMIVIAIIGVLAAIALPMYQDYVIKAQITRVYYEISSTRSAVEDIILNGNTPTLDPKLDSKAINNFSKYEYIGINDTDANPHSNLIYIAEIKENNGKFESILARFGKDAYTGIQGVEIIMHRDAGTWSCVVDPKGKSGWKDKYIPATCSVKS